MSLSRLPAGGCGQWGEPLIQGLCRSWSGICFITWQEVKLIQSVDISTGDGDITVVNPISDNKILPSSEGKANETNQQGAANSVTTGNRSGQEEVQETQPTQKTGDSLNVDRAKQIYNGTVPPTEGSVSNPEEAKVLASQIARQFADNVAQAFSSQAGGINKDTAALLEAVPA
jgi:hypothetical protein